MVNLTNSHSLTDFQRNARAFIEGINETKEPMLITVNGKVRGVLVDPVTFQEMEAQQEKQRLWEAIQEGERAIANGEVYSAEEVFEEMRAEYDF